MAYLIEAPDGTRMVVESLEGHDDCTVIDANSPAMTIDDLKAMKRAEVDRYLADQFAAGFVPSSGPLAGHTLQVRDDTDRTNWLTSQASYQAAIAAGAGAAAGATFRTAENETITATFQEGFDALMAMAAWGQGLMGKSWALKDALAALADFSNVQEFDVPDHWATL